MPVLSNNCGPAASSIRLMTAKAAIIVLLCVLQIGLASCKAAENDDEMSETWMEIRKLIKRRINEICDNDNVYINYISEMRVLSAAVIMDTPGKCANYLSSMSELAGILQQGPYHYCDQRTIELMKEYHFRFIKRKRTVYVKKTKEREAHIREDANPSQLYPEPPHYTILVDDYGVPLHAPLAVRHFFLKFALQVSRNCKKNMIANLIKVRQELLNERELEILEKLGKDGSIGKALGAAIKDINFHSILYIPELDGIVRNYQGIKLEPEGKDLLLRTNLDEESSELVQFVSLCKNRLKPIYDRLIMPVITLSKLGYDYQNMTEFSEQEAAFLQDDMTSWLVVVHVCELYKNANVVIEAPSPPASGEGQSSPAQGESDATEGESDAITSESNAVASKSGESGESDESDESGQEGKEDKKERKSIFDIFKRHDKTEQDKLAKAGVELKYIDEKKQEQVLAGGTLVKFEPIPYEPTFTEQVDDAIMIKRIRDLATELARKYKTNPHGFSGLMRKTRMLVRKAFGQLDFYRFSVFRRHSVLFGALMNFVSSCTNVASITISIISLVHG